MVERRFARRHDPQRAFAVRPAAEAAGYGRQARLRGLHRAMPDDVLKNHYGPNDRVLVVRMSRAVAWMALATSARHTECCGHDNDSARNDADHLVVGRFYIREEALRILFISYYFPPYNIIASLRVGKTAKYLRQFGHDVRVVTARNLPYPADLPVEVPDEDIIATPWIDVSFPHTLATRARRHRSSVVALLDKAPTTQISIQPRCACSTPTARYLRSPMMRLVGSRSDGRRFNAC